MTLVIALNILMVVLVLATIVGLHTWAIVRSRAERSVGRVSMPG